MVTSRGGRVWSPAEDAAIREHYPTRGSGWDEWRDILPGRTVGAIRARARDLGVHVTPEARSRIAREALRTRTGGEWTDGDVAALATHYPWRGATWDGWRDILPGKVPGDIAEKAKNLGIRRRQSRSFTNEERRAILTSIMALAIALGVPPRDVADEVVRLGMYHDGMSTEAKDG